MRELTLSVVFAFVLVFSACTVDRSELEADPSVFGRTDSEEETDPNLLKPEMDDTLIYDKVDYKARKTIEIEGTPKEYTAKLLSEHIFFDNYDFEKGKIHTVLEYPYADNKLAIITATSAEGNDCEDCVAYLSLFLFEQDENWKLTEKQIQFEDLATYGNIDFVRSAELESTNRSIAGDIDLKFPSDEHLYILLNSAYVSGREYEGYSMIFSKAGNKYQNTGVITTEYRNDLKGGAPEKITRWEGEISFKTNDNKKPDIILDLSGEKNGRSFLDTQVYVYEEDKYILKN